MANVLCITHDNDISEYTEHHEILPIAAES